MIGISFGTIFQVSVLLFFIFFKEDFIFGQKIIHEINPPVTENKIFELVGISEENLPNSSA